MILPGIYKRVFVYLRGLFIPPGKSNKSLLLVVLQDSSAIYLGLQPPSTGICFL